MSGVIALGVIAGSAACSSGDEPATAVPPQSGSSASPRHSAAPTGFGLRYKDVRFTMEGGTPPEGSDCRVFTANFVATGPHVSEQRRIGVGSSADLMFFNCGDEAKIRFGGYTVGAAEVTGSQTCAVVSKPYRAKRSGRMTYRCPS
jgi:hypothetical protein